MAKMTSALRSLFATRFSSSPPDQQRNLVEAFLELLPQTHLIQWQASNPIPSGSFVLVGVMVGWNTYDQELTAALDEAVAAGGTASDTVAVLPADDMTSVDELEAAFPGLRAIGQSPYVGLWDDQRPRLMDAGPSAVSFLSDRYGLELA
jgi:hypothetical protein